MKSDGILHELKQAKLNGKEFIKWWGRENDFADYETIDQFVESADFTEIEGFELLDIDEMWELAKDWKSFGLRCWRSTDGQMIQWQYTGKDGKQYLYTCQCALENIMKVFDVETRGDTIV